MQNELLNSQNQVGLVPNLMMTRYVNLYSMHIGLFIELEKVANLLRL